MQAGIRAASPPWPGRASWAGWLRRCQLLSLDVVAGVIGGAAFAVVAAGRPMPLAWWLGLPLATWSIYLVDRLLDGRRAGPRSRDPRRRFYRRYRRRLALHAGVALAALAALALFALPGSLLGPGAVLALAAVAHLVAAQRRRSGGVPKEVSAATVYTAGIWFGPLVSGTGLDPWLALLPALHFVAALANLTAFSLFEQHADRRDGQRSWVRSLGASRARLVLERLTRVGLVLALVALVLAPPRWTPFVAALAALVALPALLDRHRVRFAPGDRYRAVGDLAFVLLALPAWWAS